MIAAIRGDCLGKSAACSSRAAVAERRELDMKLVGIAFRRTLICLGGGFVAAIVTAYAGMELAYCIAAGVVTLGGVLATIFWKVSRRRNHDWYDVAADVGFLTLFGSVLFFLIGAYFGGVWWMIRGSVGGMIAAFFIILIGIKAFPRSET